MIHHITDGLGNFLSYDTDKKSFTVKEISGVKYEHVVPNVLDTTRKALMRSDDYKMNLGNGQDHVRQAHKSCHGSYIRAKGNSRKCRGAYKPKFTVQGGI